MTHPQHSVAVTLGLSRITGDRT